jgi:predicted XRE-type DNA-binding protein
MVALMKYIENENITQKEAAKRFGITQSRVSNLIHCRAELFSTDMLLDILERIGFKVYEKMKADIYSAINKPWFNFGKLPNSKHKETASH